MSTQKRLKQQRLRRLLRVRNKLTDSGTRPRVSVFRSSKHIYAQIINDKMLQLEKLIQLVKKIIHLFSSQNK